MLVILNLVGDNQPFPFEHTQTPKSLERSKLLYNSLLTLEAKFSVEWPIGSSWDRQIV